ncbi:MAG: CBS domain-containing protein [Youngiibacter sp.]|nr:CBS domain-containing protein [Youngiibacter sp.]
MFKVIIELNDEVKAWAEEMRISGILKSDIVTVSPDDMIADIIQTLVDTKYPLPVVDEYGRFKGIVSRATVYRLLYSIKGDDLPFSMQESECWKYAINMSAIMEYV